MTPERDEGVAIIVPDDAGTVKPHYELGNPNKWWIYHTAEGKPLFFTCRFYKPDGSKEDRPLTYRKYADGRRAWAWKSIPQPRILFNLNALVANSQKPILVCEGEKAVEAASELFTQYVVTTSPNGAGSADCADWSACKDREVIIWPDNDNEGRKYAQNVADLVLKAGALSVRIVQVPEGFPEKWDLADSLPEGCSINELQSLIDDAENIRDPYIVLLEESKTNAGAPFKKENLEFIRQLQEFDKEAYEQLRVKLKIETDVRLVELDKALKTGAGSSVEQSQIDILLMLASPLELFCSPEKNAYADIIINDRRQTWLVKSTTFKYWLIQQFFEEMATAPNAESLAAAINAIFSQALYNGSQRQVYIRTAAAEGKLYIDLCNDDWSAVRIDENGWDITNDYPVRFIRSPGMLSLPIPSSGGEFNALRPLLNFSDNDTFILTLAWLLGALRYSSQYPILVVTGEYGSAKSSFCEFLRKIIDPNIALLRTLPDSERDLYISTHNSYALGFDNISSISNSMSDALCRISTGGGFSTRALYTNDEEKIFTATRPIILNGIENIAKRSDLVDRCITITLKEIPEEERKLKEEIEREFEMALPDILGGLFTAMSYGLRNLPNVQMQRLPRMADFARWVCACEKILWPEGTFINAYNANRLKAMDIAIESCSVARAIIELMDGRTVWTGSATDFLLHFKGHPEYTMAHDWPKNPEGISGVLKRMAAPLRGQGIYIKSGERESTRERKRLMVISKPIEWQKEPS